jgi:hypothetical protein
MLDQPVPNPLAKNPNIHTHKVFASVGLILIGAILALAIGAIVFKVDVAELFGTQKAEDSTTIKVATNSAKKATGSATKDETADWKTYTNNTYRFSFKYPDSWEQKTTTTDSWKVDVEAGNAVIFENKSGSRLTFSIKVDPSIAITLEKTETVEAAGQKIGLEYYTKSDGRKIVVTDYTIGNSSSLYKADRFNAAMLESGPADFVKDLSEFKQILSTFKFL